MRRYFLNTRAFIDHVVSYFKGVKVFALVGKAGTGKSFRAQLIAQDLGIDLILDDGLLIRGRRILAGRSAKKEKLTYSAVKAAIFHAPHQAREVKEVLKREEFNKILVLGTSDKMIGIITDRLDLPYPTRIIRIEDIATEVEIEAATHSRKSSGKHIIPVPAIEVKKDYAHIILDPIHILFNRRFFFKKRKKDKFEKTIVRPEYSRKGKATISEAALSQMVMHCVNEYSPAFKIEKIVVSSDKARYKLEVVVQVPFGMKIGDRIQELRRYILKNIELFTGLDLREVNVTVGKVGSSPKAEEYVPDGQTELEFKDLK